MAEDLTGAYCHRDTGKTLVGKAYADSFRFSFTGKDGKPVTIYRSTTWLRRAIRNGILTRMREGTCPTS